MASEDRKDSQTGDSPKAQTGGTRRDGAYADEKPCSDLAAGLRWKRRAVTETRANRDFALPVSDDSSPFN